MLKILYEDAHIIVVWKPVGLEAQSSRGFGADMVSEIKRHIHKSFPKSGEPYVGVIHRLDKPVSGVMVYAKEKTAAAVLSRQAADGKMQKKYLAVLCGEAAHTEETFVDYLLKEEKSNLSKIVDKGTTGAKRAELTVRPWEMITEEPYGSLTLAEVELKTGRHHQIRVQMAGHGLPLWGDNKYNPIFNGTYNPEAGNDSGKVNAQRQHTRVHVALASWHLAFAHPTTGEHMVFEQLPDAQIFHRFSVMKTHSRFM